MIDVIELDILASGKVKNAIVLISHLLARGCDAVWIFREFGNALGLRTISKT